MTSPLARFEALTFDCYGTLVDWHAGVTAAVAALPSLAGADVPRLVADREAFDLELVRGPYLAYSEVLRRSLRAAAERQGLAPTAEEQDAFAASMADWPPFAESAPCLTRLAARFRLAVLSNVEGGTLAATLRGLEVEPDVRVTAEEIRSYKPGRAHFDAALERLDLPREAVLHVAQSPVHDLAPAQALGWRTAWVNRLGEQGPAGLAPTLEVADLGGLCDALGA